MKSEQLERVILERAVSALRDHGIDARLESLEGSRDARLRLELQGKQVTRNAEVKRHLTRDEIGAVLAHIGGRSSPVLVLTYVPDSLGQALRERGVDYIDTAGNASLRARGVQVLISGKRQPDRSTPVPARAFRPAGLRLILALLSVPDLLNAPYREMAELAPTALGGVPKILESLTEAGHVRKLKGRRRFVDVHALVAEWSRAYARTMWGRGLIGRFTGQLDRLKRVKLPPDVFWGGEAAAAMRTKQLSPETYALYTNELPEQVLIRYRLRRDEAGRIEFRRRFWRFSHAWDAEGLAPPLLVYADLLAIGESRTLEAAGVLYEDEIRRSLESL